MAFWREVFGSGLCNAQISSLSKKVNKGMDERLLKSSKGAESAEAWGHHCRLACSTDSGKGYSLWGIQILSWINCI